MGKISWKMEITWFQETAIKLDCRLDTVIPKWLPMCSLVVVYF